MSAEGPETESRRGRLLLLVALALGASVAACSPPDVRDSLECLPGGPNVVGQLLARKNERPIAVAFGGGAYVWNSEAEVWQELDFPAVGGFIVDRDESFLAINHDALYRSTDFATWEKVGPGGSAMNVLLGSLPTGAYWSHEYFGRLLSAGPGALSWTPQFESGVEQHIKKAVMAPDGTVWAEIQDKGTNSQGLYRVAPDGASLELVLGCDRAELRLCTKNIIHMTVNTRGDLFFVNDRFYQVFAGTKEVVERGRIPQKYVGVISIAAVNNTLLATVRDSGSGGDGFLLKYEEGQAEPKLIGELRDRNSEVVASTDGSRVFVHSPGVCELR